MKDTMQQRIEKFNNFVMAQDIDKMPAGLFNGKMGLSIYFYHQARIHNDKKHNHFAEKLLDSVYDQVHNALPVDIENGLTGICEGILYLIENGFVKGSPNYVLKDLDDKIFNMLYFNLLNEKSHTTLDEMKIIAHVSLYFCKRITNTGISKNEKELFKQIIIGAINKIETSSAGMEKMTDPFPFSPFGYFPFIYFELVKKVYELGFYTHKLEKVCDEWSDRVLSSFPLLQAHRFLLSSAIEGVCNYRNISNWKEYADLLKRQTDPDYIVSSEFRNKNIYIHNGLAGFYFFMKRNNTLTDKLKKSIVDKLAVSEQWNDFAKADDNEKLAFKGLMTGLAGVILAYQDI